MAGKFRAPLCLLIALCLAASGLAIGCNRNDPTPPPKAPSSPTPPSQQAEPQPDPHPPQETTAPQELGSASEASAQLDVSDVVKRYDNAVVFITTFNVLGDKTGSGTGCVISSDGLVATNFHVLQDAAIAQAQLKDGVVIPISGYRAADLAHDLAIVQLERCPEHLEHFALGEPVITQGDAVITIGHPQEFKFTVTEGIISAVRKSNEIEEATAADLERASNATWVQTTAAISGGSSGSPLITLHGELVGLNTLRAAGQSLSFAIHVDHLRDLHDTIEPLEPLPLPGTNVIRDVAVARMSRDFMREYRVLIENLRATPEADQEAVIEKQNPFPIYLKKLHDYAASHPNSPAALDALVTACGISSNTHPKSIAALKDVLTLLESEYLTDTRMSDVAVALKSAPPIEAVQQLLRNVVSQSPHPQAQVSACLTLVNSLSKASQRDTSKHQHEIVALLERCASEFREQRYGGQQVNTFIDDLVFQQKHLQIGCRAPEIEGVDHEDKPFQLSEHAGKVIVLDFWADWCPHCRVMYPHEREMVERYQDQPFVLLGINVDDPEQARQVIDRGDVTWRSWLDGAQGPIAARWQIASYPSVFVLDKRGVIRATDVRGEELEKVVRFLLEEPKLDMPGELISANSEWAYQLADAPPPEGWNSVDLDDADWPRAIAPLGYGHHWVKAPLDAPVQNLARPITSYFRREFELSDVAAIQNVFLELWADDGAVVYINGQEVVRVNLPLSVEHTTVTFKPADRDGLRRFFRLDPEAFVSGRNVIAAEIHQDRPTSPDLLFDLSLSTSLPDSEVIFSSELPPILARFCEILGEIGQSAAELAPNLKPLVGHEDGQVRIEAQLALARLDPTWTPTPTTWFTKAEEVEWRQFKAAELNGQWWPVVVSGDRTPAQLATALQFLEIAHKFAPDMASLTNTLGVAQLRNGQFEQAVPSLEKSLAQHGPNPIDLASLAICYKQLDKSDEAEEAWTKLEELLQEQPDSYSNNDEVQAFYAEAKTILGK